MQLAQQTYVVCVTYVCCWIRGMRHVCVLLAQDTYVCMLLAQHLQHLLLVQNTYVRIGVARGDVLCVCVYVVLQ